MDVMDADDDTLRIFTGRYDPETGGVESLRDGVSFEDAFGQGLLDVDAAFARQDDPRTAIFSDGFDDSLWFVDVVVFGFRISVFDG